MCIPVDEFMAFDAKTGEHSEQYGFSIGKLAEELPFPIAYPHKEQRNDFPVSEIVMPSPCPVPDVTPQDSVELVESALGTDMPVEVRPSGNHRVKIAYKNGGL
jgi:hypothetical protein